MTDVLVIEDEALSREFVETCLGAKGLDVRSCASGAEAWRILDSEDYRLVIADLELPGVDAMEILRKVRSTNPDTDVLVVTGHNSVENAVECITQGAFDFLLKPVSRPRLEALVDRVLERQELIAEAKTLRRRAAATSTDGDIVCKSKQMQTVLELVRAAADTDSTVLIRGESGTGKELVATAIHKLSRRANGPLVCVNCGALPEGLLEGELFGHEKGTLTSTVAQKPGMFELADRGTILLDEIGKLSPALQVKLLRVLESGKYQRVGGAIAREVDVRVICATDRDLDIARKEGLFREDLYYRLSIIEVGIPPLRERKSDIPPIAEKILQNISNKSRVREKSISATAMDCIMRYHWPGNVRELQNVLERSLIVCKNDEIMPGDLPDYIVSDSRPAEPKPEELRPLNAIEAEYVKLAVSLCGGNKSKAAKLLHIDRGTLSRKLRA